MKRIAFKMQLKPDCEKEYKKRHDNIWQELVKELSDAGLSDFQIYYDKETDILFASYLQDEAKNKKTQPGGDIQKKWGEYMKVLMEVNEDYSPICTPLKEVFYMK
ncbi:MAG: L-rhamnose mutarotase [Candidatus Cloacimonadota bacterium]|nr:MAG: L-rhamnose mutarotase [Candidatus Cloacimonadota bacterium]